MLNPKQKYLQIALSGTLDEAQKIIDILPCNERIIIEAGTPLIKTYGAEAIRKLKQWWSFKCNNTKPLPKEEKIITTFKNLFPTLSQYFKSPAPLGYLVADLKTMDRGDLEVQIVAEAGANAATVSATAPLETIEGFIKECQRRKIDSMLDMLGVPHPIKIMRQLKQLPNVVIVHRGVDEIITKKPIPIWDITKIKGSYNVMISVAGGETIREIQRAVFNGANIVVVWKSFYQYNENLGQLAEDFLKQIK